MMFGSSIIIGGDIGPFIDKYMPQLQTKIDGKSPFSEKICPLPVPLPQ